MVVQFVILLGLLLILVYKYRENIRYSNAVQAIDQGKQDTELVFSCNNYAIKSVNDCESGIYSSPLPAQDNATLKTQLVL